MDLPSETRIWRPQQSGTLTGVFHLLGGLNWAVRTEDGSVWLLEADAENQLESLDPWKDRSCRCSSSGTAGVDPVTTSASSRRRMRKMCVSRRTCSRARARSAGARARAGPPRSSADPLHVDVEGLRVADVVAAPDLLDQEIRVSSRSFVAGTPRGVRTPSAGRRRAHPRRAPRGADVHLDRSAGEDLVGERGGDASRRAAGAPGHERRAPSPRTAS